MPKKFLKWLPLSIFLFLSFLLFITNYIPGRYLLGWDNTVPELNFGLNLQRFVFGLWQEYRGLGTLDGMAHTANLSYWMFTRVLSLVMPLDAVRYVSNILLHLIGGVGLYVLLATDVLPALLALQGKKQAQFAGRLAFVSAMGGLLYMFNLMTIQMFITPLELFSVHFAVLPWGIWILRKCFREPSAKHLSWLFIINFLGTAQAHVPTIFIPYAVVMAVFLLWEWLQKPFAYFKLALVAGIVMVCAHAFWGVPYVYSTIYKSGEISNSKQNRLGTDGTFFRNLAWGHPQGVLTFGGFQLDYRDWSIEDEEFQYVMEPWVELYKQSWYQVLALTLSLLSLVGVAAITVLMVRYRKWQLAPFVAVWFFGISMLGTDIPGLKYISAALRDSSPLFYQIFRFTFTKFSILYVCMMSVMFAVFWAVVLCRTRLKKLLRAASVIVGVVFFSTLALMNYPAFQGDFFYSALRVKLPSQYPALFSYLDREQQNARLVFFPIHSLWGWTTGINDWGHRGSGFLWQVLPQPLVDRSFDPWNKHNETMYLQMSQALYGRNEGALSKTFEKYHSSVMFYDRSIFHPGGYEPNLFTKEIESFLDNDEYTQPIQTFGDVELYDLKTGGRDTSLYAPSEVHLVSSEYETAYTTRDQAYLDQGPYIQKEQGGIQYPLSSLQRDELYAQQFLRDDAKELEFRIPPQAGSALSFPKIQDRQPVMSAALQLQLPAEEARFGNPTTSLFFNLPGVYEGEKMVFEASAAARLVGKTDIASHVVLFNDTLIEVDRDAPSATLTLPTRGALNLELYEEYAGVYPTEDQLNTGVRCDAQSTRTGSQCQEFRVSAPDAQSLIFASAVVKNSEGELPQVCLFHAVTPNNCLNDEVIVEPTNEPQSIKLSSYIIDSKGEDYGVRLVWEASSDNDPWQQLEVKTYTKADEANISIDTVLARFEDALERVENTTETVTLRFPVRVFSIDTFASTTPRSEGVKNCTEPKVGTVENTSSTSTPEYLVSWRALGCESFYFSEIDYRQQYLYHAKGQVKSGVGARILLVNPFTKRFDIDTATRTSDFDLWVPVYPSYSSNWQTDNYFQLVFNLETYAREKNNTLINASTFYPLPLRWLTAIQQQPSPFKEEYKTDITSYAKWGTTFYKASVKVSSEKGLLVLPQSYDEGWIAFIAKNPRQLLEHITYNGWANAWVLPSGEQEVWIVFWPQLLVFGGYILLGGCGLGLVIVLFLQRRKRTSPMKDQATAHRVHEKSRHHAKVRAALRGSERKGIHSAKKP